MRFLVVRRWHLGVAQGANKLHKAQPVRSGIEVEEERVECLKRISRVARTQGQWPLSQAGRVAALYRGKRLEAAFRA